MALQVLREIEYPSSDGKPMAETPLHMQVMWTTIQTLIEYYANEPKVYVWGNMFLYYVERDISKNLSPDVMVVKGVDKSKDRDVFKTWEEKHTPNLVIEVTSRKTKKEDLGVKFERYRDILKVPEYFLFDPRGDYLKPKKLRGYRLRAGQYVPIKEIESRLPSKVLGLHLEAAGRQLRLWNPETMAWLPTPEEKKAAIEAARDRAEAENERLRRELEALKQQARKDQ